MISFLRQLLATLLLFCLALPSYGYDEVGNRITQTDANNHTTKYAYDQRGRRIGRTLPMGQAESYAYDGNGNLSSRTDFNGHVTGYTYDNLNRLLSKTADAFFVTNHLGAAAVGYTYNAQGLRATMTDASGTTTYTYDNRNRLVTKATPEGTLGYTYDAAGDVKTIQSSNTNGASMSYGYDALNRLSTVTDASGATSYSYDNVGNLSGFAYPNGVAHSYSYDTRNRLTNLAVSGTVAGAPGPIASYGYTLDASGHRLSVAELNGRHVSYGYDNLYRLTSETIASDPNAVNGAVSYGYDPVGNRLQKTSTLAGMPGTTSSYNANDQLASDTYDNNGNTTASAGKGYSYDFENHLVQQAGLTIVYDGDGNRVAKTSANGTTQFLVEELNPTGYAQVMDELQSNAVVRTYTWGLELISEHQSINSTSTTSYYVFDGHGSVRGLTNASGAVTDTYDYDAFGNLIHSTGTTPNNYLFAGEQFDLDLALYYNRARYLNASTGRFWTMDTFEGEDKAPASQNKYLYTEADPVDNVDPGGKEIDELAASFAVSETLDAMPQIQPVKLSFEKCWLTGYQCTKNKVIFAAIEDAWADSYAASPMRKEQGGWIYEASAKGVDTIQTKRAPGGSRSNIDLRNPPLISGYSVIAYFHTHPSPSSEGARQQESDVDLTLAIKRNVPGLLRSELGITWYGPIRRGASPDPAAPGPVDGYPGNKSDTRYCN